MPGHRAWDRMAEEPPKAYAFFLLYRSLGVGRTIKEMAQRTGHSRKKIQIVANRFNWVFRADQWDAWALHYRSKAQEIRLIREAQMEAKTVSDVLKMARVLARRVLRNIMRNKEFTLMPTGAGQLADLAVKLARLQRGEATSRSETTSRRVREELKDKLEQMAKDLDKEPR